MILYLWLHLGGDTPDISAAGAPLALCSSSLSIRANHQNVGGGGLSAAWGANNGYNCFPIPASNSFNLRAVSQVINDPDPDITCKVELIH